MKVLDSKSLVELAKHVKNEGLIVFAAIVLVGLWIETMRVIDRNGPEGNGGKAGETSSQREQARNKANAIDRCAILGILGCIGLAGMHLYNRQQNRLAEKRYREQIEQHTHHAEEQLAILQEQWQEKVSSMQQQLRQRPTVVSPRDYFETLKEWNDSGPGCVLLYNIELQSFRDRDILERTWGGIARLQNIRKVVLLLPDAKVTRWERIVLKESQQGGFLADPQNRKFDVCDIPHPHEAHELAQTRIAFALYRRGDNPIDGDLHPKVAVFVLSEPFSNLREPYTEGDELWWDYHHILVFGDDARIRENASAIWRLQYHPGRSRDIDHVLKDVEPLRPIRPEDLFKQIRLRESRSEELLRHLQPRTIQRGIPRTIALDKPMGEFEIGYDTGETLCGHYSGLDCGSRKPRQALVCVGGFTEYRHSKLLEIFHRHHPTERSRTIPTAIVHRFRGPDLPAMSRVHPLEPGRSRHGQQARHRRVGDCGRWRGEDPVGLPHAHPDPEQPRHQEHARRIPVAVPPGNPEDARGFETHVPEGRRSCSARACRIGICDAAGRCGSSRRHIGQLTSLPIVVS